MGFKRTIGFTCGSFDLIHPGHIAMLEDAKAQCGYLIVGLHTDPTIDRPNTKNKPVVINPISDSVYQKVEKSNVVNFCFLKRNIGLIIIKSINKLR